MSRSARHPASRSLDTLADDVAAVCGSGQLGVLDRAHQVERLLSALGWNVSNPREMSRNCSGDGHVVTFTLSVEGLRSLLIRVSDGVDEASLHLPTATSDWLVTTNGLDWRVASGTRQVPDESFRISDTSGSDRLQAYISKRAHTYGLVERHELRRRLRATLEAEISRALEAAPAAEKRLIARLSDSSAGAPGLGELLAILLPPEPVGTASAAPPPARSRGPHTLWLLANTPGGDIVWPEDATHMLLRKGCASFIRYLSEGQRIELLPGSVMLAATRSSFPRYHQALRTDALVRGYFVPDGVFLRVAHPYPVDTPSAAATLVAGTVDNGWRAWCDRAGLPIARLDSPPRKRRSTAHKRDRPEIVPPRSDSSDS
jgi:hypothetical protein